MVLRRSILTPREFDYVSALVEGLTDEQIAGRLGVSTRRVEAQIRNICWRLNIDERTALAAWWAEQETDEQTEEGGNPRASPKRPQHAPAA